MKKLIYFYCEDLRGFEDTEFNFSSKYKIHFDKETKILTIDKGNENYIDNFYGDNIELNAIVGNNGAGKSTLLKTVYSSSHIKIIRLYEIRLYEIIEKDFSGFILYYKDREHTVRISNDIVYPINAKLVLGLGWLSGVELQPFGYRLGLSQETNVNYVYVTQVLDKELYFENYGNYSTGGMIINAEEKDEGKKNIINSFFYYQFVNQMNFLSDKVICVNCDDEKIKIPFKIPEFVVVSIRYEYYYEISQIIKKYDINNQMIDNFMNETKELGLVGIDGSLLEVLLFHFLDLVPVQEKSEDFLALLKKIFNDFKNMKDIYEKTKYFFCKMAEQTFVSVKAEPYQEFLELFMKSHWRNLNDLGGVFYIPFKDENGNDCCGIKEFCEKYLAIEQKKPFLSFSWGLSSGETAMLDLYSKFYQIRKSIKNSKNRDIILLIDEADAYFHPQWQRDYVKDTLDMAKQIFEGFGVQIILATHSPIMLSDIPKQNVLYLKKEENVGTKVVPREERLETFGANIFSLFKDTFFLEGSGIGSFAEENLEELLKRIHNLKEINEEEIEYIKKRIMMIGDPFIRQKFENEFCICIEKKDSQRSLDEKIRFFEKEIESLKKQKERDKNDKD